MDGKKLILIGGVLLLVIAIFMGLGAHVLPFGEKVIPTPIPTPGPGLNMTAGSA